MLRYDSNLITKSGSSWSSIEKFPQIFWEMCVIWRSSNAYHYLCKCHRNAWSLSRKIRPKWWITAHWNGGLKTSLKVEPLYYADTIFGQIIRYHEPISVKEPFLNRLSLCILLHLLAKANSLAKVDEDWFFLSQSWITFCVVASLSLKMTNRISLWSLQSSLTGGNMSL